MSDAPTSAVDRLDLKAALAAGWDSAEIEWETHQERAAELAQAGNLEAAIPHWRHALAIARDSFGPGDPRLGTSLANLAYGLRETGEDSAAVPLFEEAKRSWDASWNWINQLRITPRARSSLYHLRMELRHRDQYEANIRKRLEAFATEARAAVDSLAAGGAAPSRTYRRWYSEKPPLFNDPRKLLAACLLLVSAAAPEDGHS